MSTLGLVHTALAFLALALGAVVLLRPKRGRWHRSLGHLYFSTMLGLNITGLFITEYFGGFGPFHWMAVASLIGLSVGMLAVLLRRPRKSWKEVHGGFMAGSYVGLVAAAGAEVAGRLPGIPFAVGVTTATVLINAIGIYLVVTRIGNSVKRTAST